MTHSPSKAALASGIQQLQAEAAGVMDVVIVRRCDGVDVVMGAVTGDPESKRLARAIIRTSNLIERAPKRQPMLCATCDRSLRAVDYAFVVVTASRGDPEQALTLAVCTCCATTVSDIKAKAFIALMKIWPDARPIVLTHPEGGRA